MAQDEVRDLERELATLGRMADSIGFLATRFSWHSIRRATEVLEPLGLKTRPYAVLELALRPGGVAQRELGRILCLDPSAIVALIDGLEKQGLVVRRQDPTDRRRSLIVATPAGAALADVATAAVTKSHADLFDALPDETRAILLETLQALAMGEDS